MTTGSAERNDRSAQRFLDAHLGSWVGPFTAAVRAARKAAFTVSLPHSPIVS